MDAGRSEVVRFLAVRPPFDALAPEELGELAAETQIEFYLQGAVILSEDGGPVTFLRVIHSGAVDLTHDGKLLDLLGPGQLFGHAAMLSGLPPGLEARAAEDTLCYRIPVAAARPLLEAARSRSLDAVSRGPGQQPVAALIRSPTVRCGPMESIRDIAGRMTEVGASCAVVDLDDGRFGIVTDRDIRTRVVAAGLPVGAPVANVMTTPVHAIAPDRLGDDVLFELLEYGIHHAPVVTERGRLIGVIEDVDLFGVQPRSWFGLRRTIAHAQSVDELAAATQRLPEVVADLHASSVRAIDVARVLSALLDAVTVRAIELATDGFAMPEDGLVWVAVGSQARRELTLTSIVRGALVCDDAAPSGWVEQLSATFRAAGIPDTIVARSPQEWLDVEESDELTLQVLVDRRPLWGTPREPLPVAEGEVTERVLAALAHRALAYSPPTGFDADSVLEADGSHSDRLDIRRAALIPIVDLGRWAGAAAGMVEGSTPERLAAAAAKTVLSDSDASSLTDAFELALELRLTHHAELVKDGSPPDDLLAPEKISMLTRDRLRDVFRAVAAVQRRLRS